MWTEIFLLIAVSTITTCVRIDGLQNDLGTGYTYSQPQESSLSTVQASLAYYVNIPANQEPRDHFYVISNSQYPSQYSGVSPHHGFRGPPSHQTIPESKVENQDYNTISHFSPYTPVDSSPAFQVDYPHHSTYLPHQSQYTFPSSPLTPSNPQTSSSIFHKPSYQIDPRSRPYNPIPTQPRHRGSTYQIQQSIVETVPRIPTSNQYYQRPPLPSQDLLPPRHTPHVTLQIEPKSFAGSAPQRYRVVPSVASLPMSYNARLPFPIGAVPIKFRPLPLKTHLRQGLLPPITSYQARESYRK